MKRTKSRLWEVARTMPPLRHSVAQDSDFEIQNSEVAKWLASRPELMQMLFNAVKDQGKINYDATTSTWRGVDYEA